VLRFIPGTLVGVPLGLWAVKNADQEFLIRLLGAYVVAYALWSLFGERLVGRALKFPDWVVYPIGVAGALIATLSGDSQERCTSRTSIRWGSPRARSA
jgi:uncharacterized membrane protein YfcA